MNIPLATYRLQFYPGFGFAEACEVMDYLALLGVSHVYASPVFETVSGSAHGYDIVDPNRIRAELGGERGLRKCVSGARRQNLGWIQDIVPNHLAYNPQNRMLMDLFESGARSRFLPFFDIDWENPRMGSRCGVLAPLLGRFYGECLEAGELTLIYDEEGLGIRYADLRFPLRLESYFEVFTMGLDDLEARLGPQDPVLDHFIGTAHLFRSLVPEGKDPTPDQIRYAKRMMWELYDRSEVIRQHINGTLERYNGERGKPESFDLLDHLLASQWFRLSYWKVATEEINYRRFFTINDLICLRTEDPAVMKQTHTLIAKLVEDGTFDGLRVDHVDGLTDPAGYLEALRALAPDHYLVVEKILESEEKLPDSWPVHGTTGYDFLGQVTGLLVDRENARAFTRFYTSFTGHRSPPADILSAQKRLILERHLAGEFENLVEILHGVTERDRQGLDITPSGLRSALAAFLIRLPVYRTYLTRKDVRAEDMEVVAACLERSAMGNPDLVHEFGYLKDLFLGELFGNRETREPLLRSFSRLQQLSAPLMAKGFEDTFLYIYNRLLSVNEVGSDPIPFGVTIAGFHTFNMRRLQSWPHSMNATATHDTKRGEDVRARLSVLSEMPDQWEAAARRWAGLNRKLKPRIRGKPCPEKNDEYFFYQTLVGCYPFKAEDLDDLPERLSQYVVKAVREAKVHTEWIKPDEQYESAFLAFLERVLSHREGSLFMEDFLSFQEIVAHYGVINALSQVLLKSVCPGIPDFYQGSEFWDLSLVDPDNRRPVDFAARKASLERTISDFKVAPGPLMRRLLSSPVDGAVKQFLIWRLLAARTTYRSVFEEGAYVPVRPTGDRRGHLISLIRRQDARWALAAVPRFATRLVPKGTFPLGDPTWGDTALTLPEGAPRDWRNMISGEELVWDGTAPAGAVFRDFPVALFIGEEGP